ncbi:MAG: cation transporter [Schleiferiaceae bacterium]|jgi:copper chaperone CopZ|nr:cation transporter [Schleiferiaceae bacterium]
MTTTYKVKGMTCGGCATTVTNILKMQPGVNEVDVSLEDNEAKVDYDDTKVSSEKLQEVVGMMGYEMRE